MFLLSLFLPIFIFSSLFLYFFLLSFFLSPTFFLPFYKQYFFLSLTFFPPFYEQYSFAHQHPELNCCSTLAQETVIFKSVADTASSDRVNSFKIHFVYEMLACLESPILRRNHMQICFMFLFCESVHLSMSLFEDIVICWGGVGLYF